MIPLLVLAAVIYLAGMALAIFGGFLDLDIAKKYRGHIKNRPNYVSAWIVEDEKLSRERGIYMLKGGFLVWPLLLFLVVWGIVKESEEVSRNEQL